MCTYRHHILQGLQSRQLLMSFHKMQWLKFNGIQQNNFFVTDQVSTVETKSWIDI